MRRAADVSGQDERSYNRLRSVGRLDRQRLYEKKFSAIVLPQYTTTAPSTRGPVIGASSLKIVLAHQ